MPTTHYTNETKMILHSSVQIVLSMVKMDANNDKMPMTILIYLIRRPGVSRTLCAIIKGFIDVKGHKDA